MMNQSRFFTVDEIQLFVLLFADDTVLFSYTADGLQKLLNKLNVYCNSWGIQVNTDKTMVMVCKNGSRDCPIDLYYANVKLKVVKSFNYLGVTINSNGNFYKTQKTLSIQASKALFSLNSLFNIVSLNISEKLKLFDSMVSPILHYGAEVWGFHKTVNIERIHTKFLKQILGIRQNSSNIAVYGELGRAPLIVIRKIRMIKY